jgi:N-acyl homoserine lactone hydrolase
MTKSIFVKSICIAGAAVAVASWLLLSETASSAQSVGNSKELRLYVMDCGVLLYRSLAKFGYKPGEVKPTDLSNGCYLIVHPTKGTLLWDAGAIPDNLWGNADIPPKKYYAEGIVPLNKQLAQIGYKPDDITYVTASHAHWDHIANLYQFAHDTWLVSNYTRDKLLSQDPPDKTDPSMFAALKDTKTITLPDDKDYDVFGDGTVTIIPTPGHTPDSRVLLIKLRKTGPVILSGDLYHFARDLITNNVQNDQNGPQSLDSHAKVQALLKEIHGKLWINHDYNQFSSLKKAPLYYD